MLVESHSDVFEHCSRFVLQILEVCPDNYLSTMTGVGFRKGSKAMEPMSRAVQFLYADDLLRSRDSWNRYANSLKQKVRRSFAINESTIRYLLIFCLLGDAVSIVALFVERFLVFEFARVPKGGG